MHTAVDVQNVAGDVGGFVAGQKNDRGGDVARRTHAAERNSRLQFFFHLVGQHSVIGVSMNPGATAFTVMLREAISMATAFVRPMSPAFAAT